MLARDTNTLAYFSAASKKESIMRLTQVVNITKLIIIIDGETK
jgi:hypothetical protein